VDQPPLTGTGIHPLPPGALATLSRVGTRGAPQRSVAIDFLFWQALSKPRSAIAL